MTATRAVPWVDEEGFVLRTELFDRARGLTPEAFAAACVCPGLVVTSVGGGAVSDVSRGPDRDHSYRRTILQEDAQSADPEALAHYAGKIAFLTKRPGNPFADMISVGRAMNSDIVLGLQSISKLHSIFMRDDLGWTLSDPGSTNGIYVEGERVPSRGKVRLKDGDSVRFGLDLNMRFVLPRSLYHLLLENPG